MNLKKRLRFGLKTFLVFCIVLGCGFAFWGTTVQRYQVEQKLIAKLTQDCSASSVVHGAGDFHQLMVIT